MESTKLKRQTFKAKYVELICHPRDFLHGGGGPQIGEVTRFGGKPACLYNLSLIW